MVVASFLTKDLLIDWRLGEQFFATHLIDYDPSSNSGGWQWASSVGTDAQPYFRIFNPYLQGARFDPDAHYIKKWVPELRNIPTKSIHAWNEDFKLYINIYKAPICDHKIQSEKAINQFKKVA
jgi:deoxyribodipyrimidine photo-lyase